MGFKGYPACVFFFLAIAVSFLAMGRVVLRARDFERTGNSSAANPWRAKVLASEPDVPSLPSMTAELQPRPPGLTTPRIRASRPAELFLLPQPFAPRVPQPAVHSVPANFSLPITFEPAAAVSGQSVQYVGHGKGMTLLLDSHGIEIAVGNAAGANASSSTLKLRLLNAAAPQITTSTPPSNASPSAPQRRRKKQPGANSIPRTRHSPNRRNMPRRDTPGHKGQAPRPQHAPRQRVPRQTKPTGKLGTPQGTDATSAESFAWQGQNAVGGESNYFLGNDPAQWRTHVQHFAMAEARNVLPGVDMVAYGNAEGVEYDLRIAPGVSADDLRLAIAGSGAAAGTSEHMRLEPSGDLIIALGRRKLRMKKPAIYEEWAANKKEPLRRRQIEGGYALAADGCVGFHVGSHDPRATLVLDPSLTVAYATFLGGAGSDTAQSIALDASGNVYIGGTTTSAATFTESGQRLGPNGSSDFFIAKINPSLSGPSSLVYLTFIGGSGLELGGAIAVDANGRAAIAGTSTSVDYPVTDGSTLTLGTNGKPVNDATVTEIDPTGATLVYSTLFGGNGNEASVNPGGIAMDSAGDIYVAMDTQSTNLSVAPAATSTMPGPYSSVYGGGVSDGFLAIFVPVVTPPAPHLKYCTYLGIFAGVTVTGVAVDSLGNAYLAGYTTNPTGTLPTANGFQQTYGGDPYDGFVMKILPSGNGQADLSYATYLGGSGMDQALAISVGAQLPGTVYVTGVTQSIDFPATGTPRFGNTAGYQTSLSGASNAFLSVIGQNPAGVTSLLYSTYLGGEQNDTGSSVFFAQANQIYVSGSTTSANFPALLNLQPFSGDQDAFVTELDPTSAGAASLLFSTSLGGTSAAGTTTTATALGNAVAADANGNVYLVGSTTAGNFPLAGNSNLGAQSTCASCQQTPPLTDAFLVEIARNSTPQPSVTLKTSQNGPKLNFGSQPVGAQNIPPQAVAVYNTGDMALSISSITLAGANSADFSLQGPLACTNVLIPPGDNCSFEVSFVPSVVGPEATFVTFTDNAPPGSQVLEAVGSGAGPLAVVSPTTLNFGNQPDGTTTTLPFTLTNAGTKQLNITNLLVPSGSGAAQFSLTISGAAQACIIVPPGGVCSVVASFTPNTTGTFTAEVEFMDNSGGGSPQAVILNGTGTGAAPLLAIAPTLLSFGTQPVGITSGMQNVTLTNTGSSPLQLTGMTITGSNSTNFGFVLKGANACPYPSGTLAAGASCTISVDFAPQAAGPVSAILSISDNAAGTPQSVPLSGTGGTSGISLAPAILNFASQTVGASSAAQVVSVNNTGTTPVAMSISIAGNDPGDFAETDNCSQSPLAGGKSCVINVTFDPAQSGSRSAEVLIADTAPHSPQVVMVSGTAVQAAATVSPSGTIGFGSALAGTSSTPITVMITNSGTPPAILTVRGASVSPAGNFAATNNCNVGVPAGGNCTLSVTFTPAASPVAAPCGSDSGTKTASLTITDNSPTSPQIIALSGTATDFCLAPAGVASQTVTAGSAATYQLVADSLGTFAGAVALSCTDAASFSACSVQPATVSLTSGAQAPIVLSVDTATNSAVPSTNLPDSHRFRPSVPPAVAWATCGILLSMLAIFVAILAWTSVAKREPSRAMRFAQTSALAVMLSIGLVACFGSGAAPSPPAGTTAGTYTITVTGTFTGAGGSTTRNVQVTLVVQ
jgi:Abnormal spindle-like microcephaly-assoc'd, ASPM-SPD-2-Hydin/Beta-propeller repeat